MLEEIWCSDARHGYDNLFPLVPDIVDEEVGWTREAKELNFALLSGGDLPACGMPDSLYVRKDRPEYDRRKPAPIAVNSGLFVISETVKSVLDGFNIGSTRIEPVKLFKSNRKTEFPGTFFLVHLTERKEAFEPDHTNPKVFKRPKYGDETWVGSIYEPSAKDGDIAVNASALGGADLWDDPRTLRSLFLSGALYHALKTAGCLKRTRAARCHIVSP